MTTIQELLEAHPPVTTPSGRLQTCYGCEHLRFYDLKQPMVPGAWGCTAGGARPKMIPQNTDEFDTEFVRVPVESCPLPNSRVNKRPQHNPLRPDKRPVVPIADLERSPLPKDSA